MHTVTKTETVWIRALNGRWHRARPGFTVELGYCAFPPCGTLLRSVVQVSTTRPDEGCCARCEERATP